MAGSSSSQLRSAIVAEVTPNTTPATPAFVTSHGRVDMAATPQITEHMSLISKGARLGHGIEAIDVSGSLAETPLVYGVYDTFLESLLQGSWTSDVLKDGKATKTFTVENTIPAGDGGTDTMMRYRGAEMVAGTLSLASRSPVNLAGTIEARGSDDATTTAITGATYTDPTEADPLSSGVDVGTIAFQGYTLDCMESLEINFAYAERDKQPKISSDDLCGIKRGNFLPVLTAQIYVESNFLAIYNAARSRTTAGFSVTIPIGSVSGEKYTLVFHNCHFAQADLDFSGPSAMQAIEIRPEYDTTEDCVLTVTRAVT